VAEDPSTGSGRAPSAAAGRPERFAALIRAGHAEILAAYLKSLESSHSPVVAEPRARDQAVADASEIIADVEASVQGSGIRGGDRYAMLAWMIGEAGSERQVSTADLLSAAAMLFDVTVNFLAGHVQDDPELLPCFATAVVALNEALNRRLKEVTMVYTGYLLERVDQAQSDERRRIARDLHDRLGEGLSVALRQLELHEIGTQGKPPTPRPRVAMAKDALTEAMHRLRVVTSDLRQESVRSLEKALVQYIDSAAAPADVRLRVSGDETWASSTVLEEAFVIVREAIRNALRHGDPQVVLIGVALAPHELHAWVEDNGCGFTTSAHPVFTGTGLASMRERAALLDGRLTIASAPGQGTQVELLVPLPGRRDDQRG
jgi:signal transduction histidine kinase